MLFLANALSVEKFGLFQYYVALISLASIIALPGVDTVAVQNFARFAWGNFSRLVIFKVLFTSISITFGTCVYLTITDYSLSFWVFPLLFILCFSLTTWKAYFAATEKLLTLSIIELLSRTTIFVGYIYLYYEHSLTIEKALIIYLATPSLVNIVFTILIFLYTFNSRVVEQGSIKYGLITSFFGTFNEAANQIDKLLLGTFVGASELAVLATADKFTEGLKSMSRAFIAAFSRSFSRAQKLTSVDKLKLKKISLTFSVFVVIVAFIGLPLVYKFFLKSEYQSSLYVAILLMLSLVFSFPASVKFKFIQSHLDIASYRNVTLKMSACRISLSLVLIPLVGLHGAVLSTLIYRIYLNRVTSLEALKYES